MGIKGWLSIGGLVLTGLAVLLGTKKKEDEHLEKIRTMIREVDGECEGEKMEDAKKEPASVEVLTYDVEQAMKELDIVDDEKEKNLETEEGYEAKVAEYRKERDKTWPEDVKKAIDMKNFIQLENLFDYKYAGGPWHPSPASVFGDAYRDGVITDEFYSEAAKYFGKLWNYSGD